MNYDFNKCGSYSVTITGRFSNHIQVYDIYNRKTHFKDSLGFEYFSECDENNNKTHYKDSNGCERWWEYDKDNNTIHSKNSNGREYWYNSKGETITEKEYDDLHVPIMNYDFNKCGMYSTKITGKRAKRIQVYENNNCIYFKDSDGYELWFEYDENNNETHYKNSNGYELWREYDENHNRLHSKDSDGIECWFKFDENGNLGMFKRVTREWYDSRGNNITEKEFAVTYNIN